MTPAQMEAPAFALCSIPHSRGSPNRLQKNFQTQSIVERSEFILKNKEQR